MVKLNLLFLSCALLARVTSAQPTIGLSAFAGGFTKPLDIAHCGDDRLFVVEQRGVIWILDKDGNKLPTPFLNIDPQVGSNGNEQGLLGLAFHPSYADNGRFFVCYTDNNGDTRVVRYEVKTDNPDQADPASALVLLEVDQPYSNHNGGCLQFGPDGYLYIGLGDGGAGGDPQNNGQKRTTLLGKMLRLDVDNGTPYGVPPDNPFVGDASTLDEIWALGLRNPWRFRFDRQTGDLWIGDVGQDAWEEINFQPAGATGGRNYGWRCLEGTHAYNTGGCMGIADMIPPVAEYANNFGSGCSVTGGTVYRGCRFPELYGHYLFTDYCSGILWSLLPDGSGGFALTQLANLTDFQFVTFGEDSRGELLLAGLGNGIIYRLEETSETFSYNLTSTPPTCPADSDGSILFSVTDGAMPTSLAWSHGAIGPQADQLTAGTYYLTITGDNGCTVQESVALSPVIQLVAAVTDESCPGAADGTADLLLSGNVEPATALWPDGSGGFERTGLSAGTYPVTITADEGCQWVDTVTVATQYEAPPVPQILVTDDTLLSVPDVYASYQWLLDGAVLPGADGPAWTATVAGNYHVVVTNATGCSSQGEPVFAGSTATSGFPAGVSSIQISPNPFLNRLTIRMSGTREVLTTIRLSDPQGRAMLDRQHTFLPGVDLTFTLPSVPAGVYVLSFVFPDGRTWTTLLTKDRG
ncbi:MAG: hypothetical protein RLY31_2440 [Bacteroidota bacterium]|jgi:glucose/arabinose dehydrogenase